MRRRAKNAGQEHDGQGRPRCLILTPSQTHDVHGSRLLFMTLEEQAEALLVDKGYYANATREEIAVADVEAVIPGTSNGSVPIARAHGDFAFGWPPRTRTREEEVITPICLGIDRGSLA